MKKFIIVLIAAVVVIGGAVAYFSMQAPKTNQVTVGVHSWPGGGMVYVGQKMGFFKEEGIDLVIKKIENFDTKRASLVSGQIDVDVANTLDQLLIYNETGFPAQIIGITDQSNGGDGLVCSESITDIQQLKGKTIAYAEASPSDFFLRYILKINNIDLKSVNFKPVADPQIAGNAVIAQKVDAAVTYEPWLSQADKEKGLHVLVSTKQYPTLIPGLLIVNGDKANTDKETYEKFLRGWFKSADYYYSHKEESQKIISEGMGIKIEDVRDILSVVDIQTKALNKKLLDKSTTNNLYDLLSSINVFWKESGFIKKDLSTEKMVNVDLIQK
ncbi:MAG: ABC transporter substrate-binding protein [Spirosomataceae bacterium]